MRRFIYNEYLMICDAMICLSWCGWIWRRGFYTNFDVRWWCFVVSCLWCRVVESHTLHWRRGLLCQATRAFMPKRRWAFMPNVPNYGQSDGYHMHNIVVSHGVGYVYFWVFWRWVLFHGLLWIAMIYDTLFCDDFCVEHKVIMMW